MSGRPLQAELQAPYSLIGLTGNIACGKSTVLAELVALGALAIDADQVVRGLQQPGQQAYEAIIAAFGAEMAVAPGGPLDRPRLGALVFGNPESLRQLEALIHPAVHTAIQAWLRGIPPAPEGQPRPVAVIDAIKLIEAGWPAVCDAVWVVACTPEQQLERLMRTRGLSREDALARIGAQPVQAEKIARADVVIDNSGTLDATLGQVRAAWARIPR